MINSKNQSTESLLSLHETLSASRHEGEDYKLGQIIRVEEELVRQISKERDHEYAPSLPRIKRDLVLHLVRYGTYLKTEYRQDDQEAERSLNRALRYDPYIPQAHYRLGFLAYKRHRHVDAVASFHRALEAQRRNPEHFLPLSRQQEYNASLYLSNSALYVAQSAQTKSVELELDAAVQEHRIGGLALSPLYDVIAENESYLAAHAFTVTTKGKQWTCSRAAYEELRDAASSRVALLDLTGQGISLTYGGREVDLAVTRAEVLLHLMKRTDDACPATKYDFTHIFETPTGEVPTNSYTQTINRLRSNLTAVDMPASEVIVTVPRSGGRDTGYYYDASLIPFMIVERSDLVQ